MPAFAGMTTEGFRGGRVSRQVGFTAPLQVVIPAKAGIQRLQSHVAMEPWMPAFAGMTAEGFRGGRVSRQVGFTALPQVVIPAKAGIQRLQSHAQDGKHATCLSIAPTHYESTTPPHPDHTPGAPRTHPIPPGARLASVGQALPVRIHAAIMPTVRIPTATAVPNESAVPPRQGPPFTPPDAHSGCSVSLGATRPRRDPDEGPNSSQCATIRSWPRVNVSRPGTNASASPTDAKS